VVSRNCIRTNSFVAGTRVLLADGSTKSIEDVQLGDEVQATDPTTGETGPRAVTDLIVGTGEKELVQVTLDIDGAAGDKTDVVTATGGHPFWVDDQGRWLPAKELKAGDDLRTATGTRAEVIDTSVRIEYRKVYNLSVDGIHTYYVVAGSVPIVVHNCNITIYRKQDTSIPETMRLLVDKLGNVAHAGSGSLYLNATGDIGHSLGFKGDQLVAFDVPVSYVEKLAAPSLPRRMPRDFPGSSRDWNLLRKAAPDQSDGPGLFV
jgi:Pretoxin HINT domain